jgi:hypothetical protein
VSLSLVYVMDSVQILHKLKKLNRKHGNIYQVGVFAADTLPVIYNKPAAFVANTDTQDRPGSHWVAFFIPKRGKPEYFDSYGLSAMVEGHLDFCSNGSTWLYNKKEFQSVTSKVCGQYCLAFLSSRMSGMSLKRFQTRFSSNTRINDKLVEKWAKCTSSTLNRCNRGQHCCSRV